MPSLPQTHSADFSASYFALFDLPERFELDQSALKARYRELQRQYHPDKFAAGNAAERRVAEQFSGHINEAYATLISPLRRAEYLLALRGVERNEAETVKDISFLHRQMELREELEEISGMEQCADFSAQVKQLFDQEARQFVVHYEKADYAAALAGVARMHFFDKLLIELEMLEARFLDE
jgi:molecular chaperone HscB